MRSVPIVALMVILLAGCGGTAPGPPQSDAPMTAPASTFVSAALTDPKAIIEVWAQAVMTTDYPTAKALMRGGPDAWETLMRSTAAEAPYTAYRLLEGPTTTDQVTTALIEWTRAAAPEAERVTCMPVTVDQTGMLNAPSWTLCPGALPSIVDN